MSSSFECPVCFESNKDSIVSTLPCKHHYHENCIMKWLDGKSDCPLCRKNIKVVLLERIPNGVTLN